MAHLLHKGRRRLYTFPPEILAEADKLIAQYGIKSDVFPDMVGIEFAPFGTHNYAYAMSVKETVAATLFNLKTISELSGKFVTLFDKVHAKSWQQQKVLDEFEAEFKKKAKYVDYADDPIALITGQRAIQNQDEIIVLFAQYKVLDSEPIIALINNTHLITWGVIISTLLWTFGLTKGFTLLFWIILLGIIATEIGTKFWLVTGSSLISFMVYGVIFWGQIWMKSWGWIDLFSFLSNTYQIVSPMIADPPLPSRFFMYGKLVFHGAHHLGILLGSLVWKFVA